MCHWKKDYTYNDTIKDFNCNLSLKKQVEILYKYNLTDVFSVLKNCSNFSLPSFAAQQLTLINFDFNKDNLFYIYIFSLFGHQNLFARIKTL